MAEPQWDDSGWLAVLHPRVTHEPASTEFQAGRAGTRKQQRRLARQSQCLAKPVLTRRTGQTGLADSPPAQSHLQRPVRALLHQ
jgi:hypothetical protein